MTTVTSLREGLPLLNNLDGENYMGACKEYLAVPDEHKSRVYAHVIRLQAQLWRNYYTSRTLYILRDFAPQTKRLGA